MIHEAILTEPGLVMIDNNTHRKSDLLVPVPLQNRQEQPQPARQDRLQLVFGMSGTRPGPATQTSLELVYTVYCSLVIHLGPLSAQQTVLQPLIQY